MKIFISGGAGFIGKWIVEKLNKKTEIVILDSLDKQAHPHDRNFSPELKKRAYCIKADVRQSSEHLKKIEGSDIILHLASQTGTGQSMYEISRYIRHNVDGTAKLLEAISLLKKKPKRIILTSSRAVYGEGAYKDKAGIFFPGSRKADELQKSRWGLYNNKGINMSHIPMEEHHLPNPVSVYGFTKLWQEQLIQLFAGTNDIDFLIFRLQNVYGPKQELNNPYTNIISAFTNSIFCRNEAELFEDGNMTRDFVYVEDVAEIIAKSVYSRNSFAKIINIGSGESVTLKELVNLISLLTKKEPEIKFSGRFRLGDIRNAAANVDCLKKTFPEWSPTRLKVGMVKFLTWYLNQDLSFYKDPDSAMKEMKQKGLLKKSKNK